MSVATRLRYSLTDGAELRCAHCGYWWPIEPECWRFPNVSMCVTCLRDRARLHMAIRRQDPEFRANAHAASRRYRALLKRDHPELLTAYNREQRAKWVATRRAKEQAA